MRSGFGLCLLALALAACSDDKAGQLAAQWSCGPIEGLKAVSGENAPAWLLVGEFTETQEAPAAVAEIACNLASSGGKLFVGVSQYVGGDTDAETRMRARLEELIKKGAPIVVGAIGGDDHPYDVHARDKAEKTWAANLTQKVKAAGADRALLLLSRTDAMAAPLRPTGDRFAGYSPMATFLTGEVVSLEVAANPIPGAPGPAIRLLRQMQDGFHGQLALQSLTRPFIGMVMPDKDAREEAGFNRFGSISDGPDGPRIPDALYKKLMDEERVRQALEQMQRKEALEQIRRSEESDAKTAGPETDRIIDQLDAPPKFQPE